MRRLIAWLLSRLLPAALIAGGCWIVNSANSMQVNFSSAPPATTAYVFGFVGLA